MKTRKQNILTMGLALIITTCLGLTITTTTADATVYCRDIQGDWAIIGSDSLPSETAIYSDAEGGMLVKFNIPGTDEPYIEMTTKQNEPLSLPGECGGYIVKFWQVCEFSTASSDTATQDIITLVPVSGSYTPINYTINYYDGSTLMHTDTNITVESKGNFYEPTKKGYKLTSWTDSSGVDKISPGAIDTYYLITKGTSNNEHTINLYAVWEAAAPVSPANDVSPATGDDMHADALIPAGLLMLSAVILAAGTVFCRRSFM